jgi:hypothetical protein
MVFFGERILSGEKKGIFLGKVIYLSGEKNVFFGDLVTFGEQINQTSIPTH